MTTLKQRIQGKTPENYIMIGVVIGILLSALFKLF